jgi:hypothetical protein
MSSSGTMRDHTLVAVTAGHLVARLDLALHSDEDLDHLHHAGRQAHRHAAASRPCRGSGFPDCFLDSSYCWRMASSSDRAFSFEGDVPPLRPWNIVQHGLGDLAFNLVALGSTGSLLALEIILQTAIGRYGPEWQVRRRGPWPGVRFPHAQSPGHVRPCRCRGG